VIDENYKFGFESEDKVQIHIRTSSKVRAEYSNGNKVDGTWDVLYDQALYVLLDNGQRYVANFRHNIKNMELLSQVKTDSRDHFSMKCDETMVGFLQMANGHDEFQKTKMQCFYGVLDEGASLEKSLEKKASKLFEEDPTSAALATKNILAGVKNHTINSIDQIDQALSYKKKQRDPPKRSVYKKNEFTQ
jgi:hypothetical protein